MTKSIYKRIGQFRRQKTDNETLAAIQSLSSPTTAKKLSKKLKIGEGSTMKRVRRLENQRKVYRRLIDSSKNGTYFLIYLRKK